MSSTSFLVATSVFSGSVTASCPAVVDPVCSKVDMFDRDMWDNACEADRDLIWDGACSWEHPSPRPPVPGFVSGEYKPVCAGRGKWRWTFSNRAEAQTALYGDCPGIGDSEERAEALRALIDSEDVQERALNVDCGQHAPVCDEKTFTTHYNACHVAGIQPLPVDGWCSSNASLQILNCMENCPAANDPVCAIGEKDYASECHARCYGETQFRPNQCSNRQCSRERKPVCWCNPNGSACEEFDNNCQAMVAGFYGASDGGCSTISRALTDTEEVEARSLSEETSCGGQAHPVCDQDFNTHYNSCHAERANVHYDGGACSDQAGMAKDSCLSDCTWASPSDVVCTRDGKTFASSCHAKCFGHQEFRTGQCWNRSCSREDNPVCHCTSSGCREFANDCEAKVNGVWDAEAGGCVGIGASYIYV